MNTENNPVKNGVDAVSPVAGDKSAARWRLILLVLCAVGVGLVIGILALQVTEYLFYKAPPDVWPQPGAGGKFNAPVALSAPPVSVPLTIPIATPATSTRLTSTPASTNAP